jgi:hypothetical protein
MYVEAMLGISLYSYPYLNQQKHFVLIIVYTLSSIKLEIRAEQFLPGSEGGGDRRGEMTQTLYAHMNKRKIKNSLCCQVLMLS